MPVLPVLTVVFVGIGGSDAGRVERQMQSLLHKDAHVETAKVSPSALRTLARHGSGCDDIVRGLHAEGVVAGEVMSSHGNLTLRVVVYGADGGLKDLVETPLSGPALGKGEIESLRSNLMPDVLELAGAPSHERDGDDDDAPRLPAPSEHPVRPETEAKDHEAEPTETADASDAVSADDILALTMGGDGETGGGPIDTGATSSSDDGLRMRAAVGVGVITRDFAPGPATVAGYSSTPVGAIRLDAAIDPTAHTSITLTSERAVGMTTPLMDGAAPTTLSRWQIAGAYALTRGAVRFAPVAGLGERTFTIDSKDPSRTPDGHYGYLVAGASMSASLGRVSLGGLAAIEPVIGGAEPTEMAFGEASRWALEHGASVEVRATSHVFVRTAFDLQRFSWSWDAAGARAAGGAVDTYPSGTLSLGADY
ncbi:MAG TPA: hypothetical protein VL463_02465 [Kofleriaceae bacterium]|nr:hypothetical protein [Kofleriaceae bacterium]